jgi:hypothetical protein
LTQDVSITDFTVCACCKESLPRDSFYLGKDGTPRYKKCKSCRLTEQKERDNKKKLKSNTPKITTHGQNKIFAAFKVLVKVRDRLKGNGICL